MNNSPRPTVALTRIGAGLAVAALVAVGLTACFDGDEAPKDVTYSATVDGGTIEEVTYDVTGPKSVSETPKSTSWTKKTTSVTIPMVYVTPSGTGVAQCTIVDSNKKELANVTGKPGERIQCTIPV